MTLLAKMRSARACGSAAGGGGAGAACVLPRVPGAGAGAADHSRDHAWPSRASRRDTGETLRTERGVSAARRVRWAVSAIARHSVVEFVCFPQALAGYTMLRWRGCAEYDGLWRGAIAGGGVDGAYVADGGRPDVLGGEVAGGFYGGGAVELKSSC